MKKNVVVVDVQFGDSGKGKVVDLLADKFDVVARFHGSGNAGHSIWHNGKKTVLHLVPCGILHPHIINVIATGVMVDPIELLNEIKTLRESGIDISPRNLKIASNASIVHKIHRMIDVDEERMRGNNKIGTTCRGVGPSNVSRIDRSGLKLYDLLDRRITYDKLSNELKLHKHDDTFGFPAGAYPFPTPATFDAFVDELLDAGKQLEPYLIDGSLYLDDVCRKGGVLFEGAQSALLDVDHGIYPFVTSSHCLAGYAAVGSGVSPHYLDEIVGVMKAYTTRVGAGPFPSEITGPEAEKLRERGGEYGSTTGRPRRVGWLDLVALKYAARVHGLTSLALTKLDVLSGYDEIKVCTHYTRGEERHEEMPVQAEVLNACTPNYISVKGWRGNISGAKNVAELPIEVRSYIELIESALNVPVTIIGVGPDREQTITVSESMVSSIDGLIEIAQRDIVM